MEDAKRKTASFGGCTVDHFSPNPTPGEDPTPETLNVTLPFEEALKLHLAIGQCLAHLNGYNRSTTDGRSKGLLLSVRLGIKRVVVLEGKVGSSKA